MKPGEAVFIDTGAWIALAVERDGLHERAVEAWQEVHSCAARLFTSLPVVIETFTFLSRNTNLQVALDWKRAIEELGRFRILECRVSDLRSSWEYFDRRDLPRLSAVDATSFVLMRAHKIRHAMSFDTHFARAGFVLIG